MSNIRTQKDENQIATEQLFRDYMTEKNWSSVQQCIRNLFVAHYSSAYPVKQIGEIIKALYGWDDPVQVKLTLSKLVRAKVLRSRVSQGQRRYEVNY